MAAAINLQLAGENYPGIRLVSSKEAGCVAIGDNNVFKIWKKDSEGKAIETGIILLTVDIKKKELHINLFSKKSPLQQKVCKHAIAHCTPEKVPHACTSHAHICTLHARFKMIFACTSHTCERSCICVFENSFTTHSLVYQ